MRVNRHADACKGIYYTRTNVLATTDDTDAAITGTSYTNACKGTYCTSTNALATTGDIEAAITGTSLHPNLATVSQPVFFFEDT